MVFWGAKLKPKKPFLVERDELEGRRLHISQATLGQNAKDGERSILKCKGGEGPPVFVCSLKPGLHETCYLDLNFEDDVVFSVTGSTPIHLSGYYMEPFSDEDDDESYDGEEDEFDQDFIVDPGEEDDDEEDDEDLEEERLGSGVKIEEITNDDEPEKALPAPAKANTETQPAQDQKDDKEEEEEEEKSEDEDGFALPSKRKAASAELPKKSAKTSVSDTPTSPGEAKKNKKKKGKKAANQEEGVPEGNGDGKLQEKKARKKDKAAKKFPNGLEVQDLALGKPDGKQAKPGKKVLINYVGKLKSNGKIFDSTIGRKPFRFRLGVNEVVKGFDVGVNGMRVGDKRRVVIPPSMGYGARAVGSIPPNSWLVFEIELVDVA
ncbi:peptidyl-prolyl cis-trans isomerase FKBP53 [Selaginella moellendorffii]|uniref:peptidyl-prolyl cis-trans isomerase FKBP53 n=1 Tax=Selaginella moellendorffii TaxID=88036 RepID=UPI000D1CA11E|nr:peptidyl-prolyl cis-trans isomerase FKBP53 [Selaginella moellendorffii]|eukprot:XP_002991761.2 peptidyl-prolyl cis-trans isomerase FKBP53 [Selaginella moellendorffii]